MPVSIKIPNLIFFIASVLSKVVLADLFPLGFPCLLASEKLPASDQLCNEQKLFPNVQEEFSDIQKLLADVPEQLSNVQKLFLNVLKELSDIQKLLADVPEQLCNEQKLFPNVQKENLDIQKLLTDVAD
jgi:hypothetical protein